jgi:SAM-dependent methyltransferase
LALQHAPVYDRIGERYRYARRQDPRIARAIWSALGTAAPVVNVGAGGGSYEPGDRRVVAVEPSAVMIAQRVSTAAPAIQAVAEQLPFPDMSFGAAMGVLTVHHWSSRARGLAELKRVSRGPVVRLEHDLANGSWHRRWGHLLDRDELDLGYRVLVARPAESAR